MTKQKLYKATRLCVSACIWNENGPKLAADFHFKVFCSKLKRKPRRWKRTGKTGTNVVMQSKMVTQAALFHYFPSDCRCHSYRDLKTEYGAVKMVLYRAEIPDRRSRSVWSEAESWVWTLSNTFRSLRCKGTLGVFHLLSLKEKWSQASWTVESQNAESFEEKWVRTMVYRGTFLRYVASSVFELCFRPIWPWPSLWAECPFWISTSSNKSLFLLMTPELPQ